MPANERRIMLQNITHIRCGLAAGELAREAACFIAHNFADDADRMQKKKNQTYNSFQCGCCFCFFLSFVLVCFVWNSAINAKDYDSPHYPPFLEH
jgi:hypothetical protein